jgi:hypothetical protein
VSAHTMAPLAPELKCPHCGWIYSTARWGNRLVPTHAWPDPMSECPGSKHVPLVASDGRPLWKDEHRARQESL